MNAQKFFKIEVDLNWGHLIKKKKTFTKRQETIKQARRFYHLGILKAWGIYTQDNEKVKEAKKNLDSGIDEAYKSCLPEHGENMSDSEYEKANREYVQTLFKIHYKFAETIAKIWNDFMKDMSKLKLKI